MKQMVVARFSMIVLAGQLAGSCALFAFLCKSFVPPIAFVPVGLLLLGIGMYWHRGKAIWIEGDRIFYRDASLLWAASSAVNDVEHIRAGRDGPGLGWPFWLPAIAIKFRGGGEARIVTFPLTPNGKTIQARLRDTLGLPRTT
jgi:hypothetical protein